MSALGQLIVTDAASSSANRRRNSRNDGTLADRDILVHYDSFTNPTEMNPRSSLVEESLKEEEEAALALEPKGHLETLRLKIEEICESTTSIYLMSLLTLWTLYQGDIRLAATSKEADFPFEVIISVCFFLFSIEIILQCFYKEGYLALPIWQDAEPGESFLSRWEKRLSIGSFYFWMDVIATFTLIFDMYWMLDSKTEEAFNGNDQASVGNAARIGARVGRILRVARIVRFTRIGRLYRYATLSFYALQQEIIHRISGTTKKQLAEEEKLKLDNVEESKVGLIMADLTNRRVICLIILMLLIIPLLNPTDDNISLNLAIRLVHQMAVLNASDPVTYESGLLLAINVTLTQLPVIALGFNDDIPYYYDHEKMTNLRDEERSDYFMSTNGTSTYISYDQQENSIEAALMSIATTSVVLVMLLGGIYAFSTDVQSLVILPIEKLVALVKKIAQNPLGVEYKMLGAEDGFQEGMETTVLLTTINKIGGLMRVGFGEAGAAIIAKNLQESTNGKLNLLGSGTLIYSIFGFCDVRQFTDTTECLQEEVMLFVNRIAHILHSIVMQCSGAANKNIGDAFLLTWKIDEKATKEQKALLADQALLTFCKALIELARHQEFICNFSVAATGRLFKRFPDYKVRIGSGLHVGWAIEGAIGSNRKIDASYISPHVSTTEFLESSTKEYGVSLLMSEPFYRLLSPAASRFVRQVDRIRRSPEEGPIGLYTYDCDLSIDWNDPFRHRKFSTASALGDPGGSTTMTARSRFQNAVRRTSRLLADPGGLQAALGLSTIQEVKSQSSSSMLGPGGPPSSSNSQSNATSNYPVSSHLPLQRKPSADSNHHNPYSATKKKPRSSIFSASSEKPHVSAARSSSRASLHPGARRPSIMLQPMNLTSSFAALPFNEEDEENPEAAEAAAAERVKNAKATPTITLPAYTQQIWVEDQDLVDLRHVITEAFRDTWAEAMDAFIIGDWLKARDRFLETLRMSGKKDGPSKHILAYIEKNGEGGSSPDGWSGFRDLSSDGGGL